MYSLNWYIAVCQTIQIFLLVTKLLSRTESSLPLYFCVCKLSKLVMWPQRSLLFVIYSEEKPFKGLIDLYLFIFSYISFSFSGLNQYYYFIWNVALVKSNLYCLIMEWWQGGWLWFKYIFQTSSTWLEWQIWGLGLGLGKWIQIGIVKSASDNENDLKLATGRNYWFRNLNSCFYCLSQIVCAWEQFV